MKTILVLCLLCASAIAYPASSQEDSNESEFINPITRKGVPSVVEVDVGDSDEDSFFFPSFFRPIFFNPFPSFKFGGFPSLFSTSAFGGFKNLFSGVPGDANVTNSTSTVKIVDGHKVTVNATVYEKNGAVFKSEVIEITRLDEPKEEGEEKSTEGPVKTDSNDEETPIKKNESPEETSVKDESLDNEILREELKDPNGGQGVIEIDLSKDIRVNELAENAQRSGILPVPEDVEVFVPAITKDPPSAADVPEAAKYTDDSEIANYIIASNEPNYLPVSQDMGNYIFAPKVKNYIYAPGVTNYLDRSGKAMKFVHAPGVLGKNFGLVKKLVKTVDPSGFVEGTLNTVGTAVGNLNDPATVDTALGNAENVVDTDDITELNGTAPGTIENVADTDDTAELEYKALKKAENLEALNAPPLVDAAIRTVEKVVDAAHVPEIVDIIETVDDVANKANVPELVNAALGKLQNEVDATGVPGLVDNTLGAFEKFYTAAHLHGIVGKVLGSVLSSVDLPGLVAKSVESTGKVAKPAETPEPEEDTVAHDENIQGAADVPVFVNITLAPADNEVNSVGNGRPQDAANEVDILKIGKTSIDVTKMVHSAEAPNELIKSSHGSHHHAASHENFSKYFDDPQLSINWVAPYMYNNGNENIHSVEQQLAPSFQFPKPTNWEHAPQKNMDILNGLTDDYSTNEIDFNDPFADQFNTPFQEQFNPSIDVPFNPPIDPFNPPVGVPFNPPTVAPFNPPIPIDAPFIPPIDVPFNPTVDVPFNPPIDAPCNSPIEVPFNPPIDAHFNPPIDAPCNSPIDVPFNPPINDHFNTPIDAHFNPPIDDHFNPSINTPFNPPIDDHFEPSIDDHFNPSINAPFNPPIDDHFEPPIDGQFNPSIDGQFNGPFFNAPEDNSHGIFDRIE